MGDETARTQDVAEQVRAAYERRDPGALRPLFAPEARWGSCAGGDEIVGWMQAARADGLEATLRDIDVRVDRIVIALDLRRADGGDASRADPQQHYLIAFIADGQIIELRDASDADEGERARPGAPVPSPLGPRSKLTSGAAVLPVRDLRAGLGHYRRLGFAVHPYEGGGYGFAERGPVEVHLGEVAELDPAANTSAIYLFVEDADALYAEWHAAELPGRLVAPTDTEYGMREGAHVDPDGNLIRFGSPRAD